uniref:PWWP domain-containing protein n=1 Tax=Globisporangium ultimum (strain ATCC 200006 / CBS 805.95 / DAOM BR144) TaxID=431595 RepID=K3WES3_GLOUD
MANKSMPLDIGLRLDVLDNEGIWNTGVIVDVAHDDENDDDLVEIKYDGWGDEFNEWVAVSVDRLAPLHMFTIVKKCWAKLTKWPWWPAFVVLRAPTKRGAIDALDSETKVYVEFFDSFEEDKRSRCWMQKKSVVSFDDNFEDRASKNIGKNFHKFVEDTQRATASSSPLLFAGAGTLPIEYSSKPPTSLAVQKQRLGDQGWYDSFKAFSDRYRVLYGFEAAKGTAPLQFPVIQRTGDGEIEVPGDDDGNGYADDSEGNEEPEEEEASAGEEDEEEEAVESKQSRR